MDKDTKNTSLVKYFNYVYTETSYWLNKHKENITVAVRYAVRFTVFITYLYL